MKTAALGIFFCAAVFASALAGTISVDATSGINGLTSGNGGLTLGWEFQVTDTNGITVDGLGFWDYQSDGFAFGQTFDVGLWDATSGTLLRESVITSASPLKSSLDTDGAWRVNSVSPLFLAPGLYRIGALMPVAGANAIVSDPATYQSAPGITLTRFLRQLGSPTLAMPVTGPPYSGAMWFGPTFTFTSGMLPPLGTVVAPGAYAATSGPSGLNTLVRDLGLPRSYQMQFTPAALGGLPVGARITELRFRLYTNATPVFPTNTVITWSDYEVTLAQAAKSLPGMSTNFAANMLSPVLVKSGALSISAHRFTGGANPNPFASLVVFDTPYVYQGGDLVMLFRHPGSDTLETDYLDAVTTNTPGYGTDFRALSANTFNAIGGVQALLTIAQIVFTYTPRETIFLDGTNMVIVGTNGPPGGRYHLTACTNLAPSIAQWLAVTTNQFDGNGSFRYTNAIQPDLPAQLFRITVP